MRSDWPSISSCARPLIAYPMVSYSRALGSFCCPGWRSSQSRMEIDFPEARYFCPFFPLGEWCESIFLAVLSAMTSSDFVISSTSHGLSQSWVEHLHITSNPHLTGHQ